MFKDYYVGRRGFYHNKNVTILCSNYNILEYQDFGLKFDEFEIVVYFEDGSKKTERLKGNQIKKNLQLYDEKKSEKN
jgi:hypothetical protein